MAGDTETHVTITRREVEDAEAALIAALDAAPDDETATERIMAAMNRLRQAQARHAAARSGLAHLPDLVGLT